MLANKLYQINLICSRFGNYRSFFDFLSIIIETKNTFRSDNKLKISLTN